MTLAQYEAAAADRNAAAMAMKVRKLIAQTTDELTRIDQGRTPIMATPAHRAYLERELKAYYEWLAV